MNRGMPLLFALAATLAGCSVGTRYRRPDLPTPQAWRAHIDAPSDAQSATWPSEDWWKGFGSARLDELIDAARHANDDIGAAVARVRGADAQARIAGAALWPSVDLTAAATRERSQPAGTGAPRTLSQFSPQIGASYELDFWGRNRSLHAAAEATANASRFDRETIELTVMTSVATTYFQALEFRERLNVARENLATAQQVLDGLHLEEQVGTVNALDVAQQETVVATLNAALPPLEEQLTRTVDALAILVGQPPENVDVATGTLADLGEPQVQQGLPSELLSRRPDVAEAESQLVAANANVNAARAALFPQISLTGAGGYASSALSSLVTPGSRVFSLTAGLTQPLFAGGALTGQVALNRARYDELLADYHKAVLSAFGNVEDSLTGVRQTAEQQRRQEQAVAQARRAYEYAQAQMRAGTVNVLTVLNTEGALFSAQDALVQVRFSHFEALVSLYNALGGGWQQS